jgi:hypothetical protein
MKTQIKLYSLLFIATALFGCKGGNGSGTGSASDSSGAEQFAVCIWDKAILKDAPEEKGKYLTSLSLGEKCTYLDDEKEDNSGAKPVKYVKIKLQDGKEGWANSDLVIINSTPAVFVQNTEMYSRPDLLTKTGKSFSKMDIIAVKSTQNDFVEVVGKRKDGKWIETGWVKPANLSYTDVDIAVAKFAGKALAIEDNAKRLEALNEIINNSDLKESVFINELAGIVSADQDIETAPVDTSAL